MFLDLVLNALNHAEYSGNGNVAPEPVSRKLSCAAMGPTTTLSKSAAMTTEMDARFTVFPPLEWGGIGRIVPSGTITGSLQDRCDEATGAIGGAAAKGPPRKALAASPLFSAGPAESGIAHAVTPVLDVTGEATQKCLVRVDLDHEVVPAETAIERPCLAHTLAGAQAVRRGPVIVGIAHG